MTESLHKSPGGAGGSVVDSPGDELLACAGLAGDQHGRIRRRHLGHERQDRAKRRRGADDLLEHGGLVDLLTEDNVLAVFEVERAGVGGERARGARVVEQEGFLRP